MAGQVNAEAAVQSGNGAEGAVGVSLALEEILKPEVGCVNGRRAEYRKEQENQGAQKSHDEILSGS